MGSGRCPLAKIKGRRFSILQHDDHEAAAPDIAGSGMGYGKGKGRGDGCVDSVSALAQDLAADL